MGCLFVVETCRRTESHRSATGNGFFDGAAPIIMISGWKENQVVVLSGLFR